MVIDNPFASRILQKLQNELNYNWVISIKITAQDPLTITVVVSNLDRVKEVETYLKTTYKKEEKIDYTKGKVTAKTVNNIDSIIYKIGLKNPELKVKENAQFEGQIINVQIETVLQNAWGILTSDLNNYNNKESRMPISRLENLQALKGVLRFVDVQFDKGHSKPKIATLLAVVNTMSDEE
jgi:ppGpp synthetase/RelA/SpoT-type nucleotidyltranferase